MTGEFLLAARTPLRALLRPATVIQTTGSSDLLYCSMRSMTSLVFLCIGIGILINIALSNQKKNDVEDEDGFGETLAEANI